ncbi:hypothetical protein GF374_02985 [Candidatus Woesearchaeota archaeon]|nr:hypothetical protein [Candidatus Woesearchaeota archaeon]
MVNPTLEQIQKLIKVNNQGDLEKEVEEGNFSAPEITDSIIAFIMDDKIYWKDADKLMENLVDIFELDKHQGLLGIYVTATATERERQEHIKKYNFNIKDFKSKTLAPKEYLEESIRQEQNGNLFDAVELALDSKDYNQINKLCDKIITDKDLPFAEKAQIIEGIATFLSKETLDFDSVEKIYRVASEFYEKAAELNENNITFHKLDNKAMPEFIRKIVYSNSKQTYNKARFYNRAAICAESAGDYKRANTLEALASQYTENLEVSEKEREALENFDLDLEGQ